MENQSRSIRITDELWRKLARLKLDLNFKSIDELLNFILKEWRKSKCKSG